MSNTNRTVRTFTHGGFVIYGMAPCWLAKGSKLTAWFDEQGTLTEVERINVYGVTKSIGSDTALWAYAAREGKEEYNKLNNKKK